MNRQELETLVENLLSLIESQFNAQGAVRPTFLLVSPAQQILVFEPLKLTCQKGKDMTAALVRQKAKEEHALAVLMVTESWMVKAQPGLSVDLEVPPSKHPNRMEVLMVSVETRFGSACYVWEIQRQGKQVRLGPRQCHENYGGRFSNLLSGPEENN